MLLVVLLPVSLSVPGPVLPLAVLAPAFVLRLVGWLAIVGRPHTDSCGSTTRYHACLVELRLDPDLLPDVACHERFLLTAQEGPPGLGKNLDVRRSRPFSIVKRHLDGLETLAQDVRSAAVVPRRFRQGEELPLVPSREAREGGLNDLQDVAVRDRWGGRDVPAPPLPVSAKGVVRVRAQTAPCSNRLDQ